MKTDLNRMGWPGKTHYKLYKSGKMWVTAGMTLFSIGLGLTVSQPTLVKAATVDDGTDAETTGSSVTPLTEQKAVTLQSSAADNSQATSEANSTASATTAQSATSADSSMASQATVTSTTKTTDTRSQTDTTTATSAASSSAATTSAAATETVASQALATPKVATTGIVTANDTVATPTVSLVTSGTISMVYKTGAANLGQLGLYVSSPTTSPANDAALYMQDDPGNYFVDANGTKVNLLYLLLNDPSAENYLSITYTDLKGNTITYPDGTDLTTLTAPGDYAITLNDAGKGAMESIIQSPNSVGQYVLPMSPDDITPTFSEGATDYTFHVKILPATIKASVENSGTNDMRVLQGTQTYTGQLTMIPLISIRDGSGNQALIISNGKISNMAADINGTIGQTVLTTADFTYAYQGTTNLTGADVGNYIATLTPAGAAKIQAVLGTNYVLDANATFVNQNPSFITAAKLTVATVPATIIYDGQAHTPGTGVTSGTNYDKLDFSSIATDGSGATSYTNAGTYTLTYTLADPTQAAILAKNYKLTATTGTLTIDKEPLTVTVANDQHVTYDGQAHGTTTSVTKGTNYDNLVFKAVEKTDGTTATVTNAGTYTMTGTTDADVSNYDVSYIDGTLTIDKAPATITLPNQTLWADGTTKNLTPTVTGEVNGEKLVYTIDDGLSTVGTKQITATLDATAAVNQNYAVTITPGTLTVGDVAVKYVYQHTNADGTTVVDSTATGTASHGTDASAADYLNYTTTAQPKVGYTLVSDNTGLPASGQLTGEGGTVVYVYQANKETATVKYVDGTTGKTLGDVDTLSGDFGTTDAYTPASRIAGYEQKGYALTPSGTDFPATGVVYDADGIVKAYTVTLHHKWVTVTPNNPATPGQPIDPSNPDGPKYPAGTDEDSLNLVKKRIIHYTLADQTTNVAPMTTLTVTYTRQAVFDAVTGEVTYGPWTSDNNLFPEVVPPVITGYDSDKLLVAASTAFVTTQPVSDIYVTYTPKPVQILVKYVDQETGTVLATDIKNGPYTSSYSYDATALIAQQENKGYQYENTDLPTTAIELSEYGKVYAYTVNFTHKRITVTPDNPGTPGEPIDPNNPDGPKYPDETDYDSLETSSTQTITYVYTDGTTAAPSSVQTVTYKRTATIDEATGDVTHTDWATDKGNYDTVVSPIITGYSPLQNKTQVPGSNVPQGDGDTTIKVTYRGNPEKATVTYFDQTANKQLSSKSLPGLYGSTNSYTTAAQIAAYEKQGYVLVSSDFPVDGIKYDTDDGTAKTYTVTLKHGTKTVTPDNPGTPGQPIDPSNPDGPKYPAGTDLKSLAEASTQTIKYVYKDGTAAAPDATQTVTFTRDSKIDVVTGAVTYTDWASAKNAYDTQVSPTLTGYTADQTQVDGSVVTQSNADKVVTVMYTPNAETAAVNYVDQKTGKTLTTDDLSGDYGTTSAYTTAEQIAKYEQLGYVLVSSDFPVDGIKYDTDDGTTKTYTVIFDHGTKTVTPDNPGTPGQPIDPSNPDGPKYPSGTDLKSLTETSTQTIKYVYKDGTVAAPDATQTVTFTRDATFDVVTGEVTYTDWAAAKDHYDTQVSPELTGYTASQVQVDGSVVAHGDADKSITVTYTPNVETATVTYVDETTGKTLATDELSGDYGTTSDYTTAEQITKYEQLGYVLVSSNFPPTLTYNVDEPQNYTVTLKHGTKTVTPDNPGTPGQPIDPSNPDGPKYPAGTDLKSLTETSTQTINYVYSDGTMAKPSVSQKVTYTRSATVDAVTGAFGNYGDWTTAKNHYDTTVSPELTGYTASQAQVDGSVVAHGDADKAITVTYTINNETATVTYVDETTGKTLTVDDLTGAYGTTDAYTTAEKVAAYEQKHYVLVGSDFPETGVVYDQDGVAKAYTVRLKHQVVPVTNADELTKTVTQTIHYQDDAGNPLAPDLVRTISFTRTGTLDLVTNVATYGNWASTQDGLVFTAEPAKSIAGFHALTAATTVVNVTPQSADDVQTLVYARDEPVTTPGETVTPGEPGQLTPTTPTTSAPDSSESGQHETVPTTATTSGQTSRDHHDVNNQQVSLPETGETNRTETLAELVGLSAVSLLAGLSLFRKKHHE
ncbi:mucin-binding protein [Furfurilactobacillus sp. WILCCON 0119]